MEVVINGTEIETEEDLHKTMAKVLDLGPYYGRNLAALWDRLTTDVDRPLNLLWIDSAHSRAKLGEERFANIVTLLKDVEQQDEQLGYENRFSFELS